MVRLHAHGETAVFGAGPANRRVGIAITDGVPEPAVPIPPTVPPPTDRPAAAEGGVRLDWSRVGTSPRLLATPPPAYSFQLTQPRLLNWGDMVQTYGEHGARLSLRDMSFLEGFGQQQYGLYRGLGFNDGQARWIADIITRRSAGVQLRLKGNTAYDRFQLESDRMGWPTTYSTPMIDILDLLRRIR